MDQQRKLALALVVGAAVGAAAVQGLHAQTKPKAYLVTETEIIDATAAAAYIPRNRAAQKAAGGTSLRTTGKITAVVGTAPKRVGITEWSNVDVVQAWLNSERRNELNVERAKATKIIRQFIVEAAN
jgi:uncharacterized protein (DUF1330 family)